MTEITRLPRPVGRRLTLDELLEWMKALHPRDRSFAARQLKQYEDPRIVEPLIAALDDPEPGVRSAAASSLGDLGHNPKVASVARQAVERLVALLEDEDEEVTGSAVYALGELGDSTVASKLLPFLGYPDRPNIKMRNVAISALTALRYRPAISHFLHMLRDPSLVIRGDAIFALFSMRHVSTDIEEILKSLVNDPDLLLRERAETMLEVIANEKETE